MFSASFSRIHSLAPTRNTRVIAANRLDYPGSASHSPTELALVQRAAKDPSSQTAVETLRAYWRSRAHEIYKFLVELVRAEHLPPSRFCGEGKGTSGGIILVGWSYGSVYMTAALAHLAEFSSPDVLLSRFLHRVVIYGMS